MSKMIICNLRIAISLIIVTTIVYTISALVEYQDYEWEKYMVDYSGTINNRWTKEDERGKKIYYFNLHPNDNTLSDYTTTVDEESYKKFNIGDKIKLQKKVSKKECIEGYKETKEETLIDLYERMYLSVGGVSLIIGFFFLASNLDD